MWSNDYYLGQRWGLGISSSELDRIHYFQILSNLLALKHNIQILCDLMISETKIRSEHL